MNADRFKQIDELFDAALDLPKTECEAFLLRKINNDDELKNEVLSLLNARIKSTHFLEKPAIRIFAKEIVGNRLIVAETDLLGKTVGTYKIESLLGLGGMGEVFLAQDEKLRRKVALKILPAEFTSDDERVKRFQLEAQVISALNHPNIVTIYDVGSDEGINYIATEYVEGKTLRELIGSGLKIRDILTIVIQSCEALSAAHNAGIIHRDIKPENIIVRSDGYVKILDFGLAKLTAESEIHQDISNHTQKGVIIGTPPYMSPAQVAGGEIDHRADLWSLGVILYEMLTGKNPFRGKNRQETLQKILSEMPPFVSESEPSLPAKLDTILEKALEKEADLGYQSASDLRADLRRVRREFDSSLSLANKVLMQRHETTTTQSRFRFFTFAFLLLTLLGFGIWFFAFRQNNPTAVDWSKATNLQLTDQAGTEFFPSLAPDGKSFVYAAQINGNYDLFLQRIGGKNTRNLTDDSKADDTQPAFSPDGERIAFRSEREPRGIYVMEATGENIRRITDFGFHPSWSPDGKEIVVSLVGRELPDVRNPSPSELWIISVETGAKRLLVKNDSMQPAWSPDRKFIAYWFYPPNVGRRDVAVISASGGEPIVITKDGTTNWNPVWSPDGQFLYFASDRGGNMNFWRVRFDAENGIVSGEPEAVITPSKYSRHLAFSRDGKRMIYVSTEIDSNIQAAGFDAKTEKIIGTPFWITRGDRKVSLPELSPDGTRFVMRVARRSQDDIVTVKRDGSDWRDITNDEAFDRYPRWSPDGKRIAFTSDRNGVYEIFIVNEDGTNLRQITFNSSQSTSFPLWSPDGKRLIFRINPRNFMIDLEKDWNEQTPQEIPPPSETTHFTAWDWSLNGKFLVGNFRQSQRSLAVYSFETNSYEQIPEIGEIPKWFADSRRFVFANDGKVFIADAETKKVREVFSLPNEQITAVGISHDNLLLYFTVSSSESDIWMLDNWQNQ